MTTTVAGFTKAKSGDIKHRIIMSVSALEKQGKTHFALTAPGPIVFLDFDIGCEGVIHKFLSQKEILLPSEGQKKDSATFQVPIIAGQPIDINKCTVLWERFKKLYCGALQSDGARTVIVDTATDAWELLRLAKFGKLTQVMPHQYGSVNAEYRELIRMAYGFNKNVILLHKMKPQYLNDKRTGKYERSGFNDTGFLVQMNTELFHDEDGFNIRIIDCRQNMDIADEVFTGNDLCNFPFVASMAIDGTSPDDWT